MEIPLDNSFYSDYFREYVRYSNELKLRSYHIDRLLKKSIANFDNGAKTGCATVLYDWSGAPYLFHSGETMMLDKENYMSEIDKMFSYHCSYMFSQAYEYLTTFLKNVIFKRAELDSELLRKRNSKQENEYYTRADMPGGNPLFDMVKRVNPDAFTLACKSGWKKIDVSIFWKIISDIRHACTHSRGVLNFEKYEKSRDYKAHFDQYFDYKNYDDKHVVIYFNQYTLDNALRGLVEFAYQVYKAMTSFKM